MPTSTVLQAEGLRYTADMIRLVENGGDQYYQLILAMSLWSPVVLFKSVVASEAECYNFHAGHESSNSV